MLASLIISWAVFVFFAILFLDFCLIVSVPFIFPAIELFINLCVALLFNFISLDHREAVDLATFSFSDISFRE